MKRVLLALLVMALAVSTCFAGITYTAVTKDEDGKKKEAVTVRGWVSGQGGKVQFENNDNPLMPAGSYIVTNDGGKKIYLVVPSKKQYGEFDVQRLVTTAGQMMNALGGLMKIQYEAPKVEKLLEEDGGIIAGLPTKHYKYRTTYTVVIKFMGTRRTTTTIEEDVWVAPKLVEAALGMYFRSGPPATGNAELDQLVKAEFSKVQGFPLKKITVTTSGSGKKTDTTRTVMEVTELQMVPVPASTFEIPAGYKQVEMLPKMPDRKSMEEAEEEE